ncbi:DUF2637 domain-containing protein [Streptomyces lavendulae]|uniref:DUF2637 domain-containing protein n=1 Tax=Streptomyces lavendulae TaxID=1914 RepID=UPI0024A00ADF|nr:DUF2637 domain-containing protein [Streptomyces lavendulae]GLX22639.1 hypothetical protein Slala01_62830 [Streptomyces lavendulae subsp. lavendulae]GLX30122.1 hypothetical protein Slala02_59420 [Streptomyces lavendulae subsp. lavendulae]
MTPDLAPHGAALAELLGSWQFVLGALVLTLGPAIALRRRRIALSALTDSERAQAADRRGRRVEDLLTVVIAAAAAALSATGLRRVGHHQMGLDAPFDLLPFVALDIAAMVCGRRARRRARDGDGPGLSGALFWTLAGISSVFSASEADSLLGGAVRAVWPVLAAVLWEIGSLEERRAARTKGGRPDRRIALVRLLHPVEAFRVALLLAARQDLAQEEATAEVRISRAAYRWYRLRRAQEAVKRAGGMTRWAYRLAEMHADGRAQDASERAGCSDPIILKRVVARLQLRVRQSDIAGMNLRNPTAFAGILTTLIGTIPTTPSQATDHHPASPSHPAEEEEQQVNVGMGQDEEPEDDIGEEEDDSTDPDDDTDRDADSAADWKTDEEVMAAFVETVPLKDDGTFAWGINKCAEALNIGNRRAKKFLRTQAEWLPKALADHPSAHGTGSAEPDHFDQALAVANELPQPAAHPQGLQPAPAPAGRQPLEELLHLDLTVDDRFEEHDSGLFVPAAGSRL